MTARRRTGGRFRSAEIAVRDVSADLSENESIEKVIFACFGDEIHQEYRRELRKLA